MNPPLLLRPDGWRLLGGGGAAVGRHDAPAGQYFAVQVEAEGGGVGVGGQVERAVEGVEGDDVAVLAVARRRTGADVAEAAGIAPDGDGAFRQFAAF